MNQLTPFTKQALGILRDPSLLQWYVIPLLAIAFYVYATAKKLEFDFSRFSLLGNGLD